MSNEKKKKAAGPIFGILAAILGLVGLAVTVYCSRMNSAYSLSNLNQTLLYSGIAAALACLSAFGKKNYSVLSTICQIGAIVLFVFAIGNILMERVLLASGLFSYNSQNQAGWQVFYVSVAAIAFYLAADLFLIISSFMKSVKD